MNDFIGHLSNHLPASGWERLAADAAWQSTALAGIGLAAAWLVRRHPALRAAILLSAAALALVVPPLSSGVRLAGGGLLAPRIQPNTRLISVREFPAIEALPASEVTIARSGDQSAPSRAAANRPSFGWPSHPWRWFVGCWLAASACLALRLLQGIFVVRRWIRLAEPCHDPNIEAALSRAAQTIGVRRPELLRSAAFDSPALVALGRARLLLPAEMPAATLDHFDWYAVFCHELAHLARRSGTSRLAVELCCVLLPWQPLLWLVRRRFRAACEEACDDWAVASGADPVELASLLVEFVPERRPAFALGMAESPSATRHRILRLLAMQGSIHPRLGLAIGVAGWVVAIALAITLAFLQSRSHSRLSEPILLRPTPPGVFYNYSTSPATTAPATTANEPPRPRNDQTEDRARQSPPWGAAPLAQAIADAATKLPKSVQPPAPYVIEPPDILLVDAVKLVPKSPYHIEPLDVLQVQVANPLIDSPISGQYPLDPGGAIDLGAVYGKVVVGGQTIDEAHQTIEKHLSAVIRDPVISVTLAQTTGQQQVGGEHHVGPDGTVNLGTYGEVYVAGMTIAEAKKAIEGKLSGYLEQPRVSVDVFAYNSKVYYVIVEGSGGGDTIVRIPVTGNETVLDALAQQTGKTPNLANCWVWVARSGGVILPVDWQSLVEGTDTTSNWRIQPGDRILVRPKANSVPAPPAVWPRETAHGSAKRPSLAHGVFAPFESTVGEVLVKDGETVKQGQVLAKLHRDDLDADIVVRESNLAVAQGKARSLQTAIQKPENSKESARLEAELLDARVLIDSYAPQLDTLKKKRDQLTLTSPVDGRVHIGPANGPLLHRPVTQGQVLMTVVEMSGNATEAAPAMIGGHSLAEAELQRGRELVVKGKIAEGRARFESAVALDPEFAQAHCDLAHALAMSGEVDQALVHYRQALEIDPQLESARQAIEKLKR